LRLLPTRGPCQEVRSLKGRCLVHLAIVHTDNQTLEAIRDYRTRLLLLFPALPLLTQRMYELLAAVEIDPSEFDAPGVVLVAPVECCAERTLSANDMGSLILYPSSNSVFRAVISLL